MKWLRVQLVVLWVLLQCLLPTALERPAAQGAVAAGLQEALYVGPTGGPREEALALPRRVFERRGVQTAAPDGLRDDKWLLWTFQSPFHTAPTRDPGTRAAAAAGRALVAGDVVNHIPGVGAFTSKKSLAALAQEKRLRVPPTYSSKAELLARPRDRPHQQSLVSKALAHGSVAVMDYAEAAQKDAAFFSAHVVQERVAGLLVDGGAVDVGLYVVLVPGPTCRPRALVAHRPLVRVAFPGQSLVKSDYRPPWARARQSQRPLMSLLVDAAEQLLGPAGWEALLRRARSLITQVVKIAWPSIQPKCARLQQQGIGVFELLRFDFIPDSDGRMWLNEVNVSPNMVPLEGHVARDTEWREELMAHTVDILMGGRAVNGSMFSELHLSSEEAEAAEAPNLKAYRMLLASPSMGNTTARDGGEDTPAGVVNGTVLDAEEGAAEGDAEEGNAEGAAESDAEEGSAEGAADSGAEEGSAEGAAEESLEGSAEGSAGDVGEDIAETAVGVPEGTAEGYAEDVEGTAEGYAEDAPTHVQVWVAPFVFLLWLMLLYFTMALVQKAQIDMSQWERFLRYKPDGKFSKLHLLARSLTVSTRGRRHRLDQLKRLAADLARDGRSQVPRIRDDDVLKLMYERSILEPTMHIVLPGVIALILCPFSLFAAPRVMQYFFPPDSIFDREVVIGGLQTFLIPSGMIFAVLYGHTYETALSRRSTMNSLLRSLSHSLNELLQLSIIVFSVKPSVRKQIAEIVRSSAVQYLIFSGAVDTRIDVRLKDYVNPLWAIVMIIRTEAMDGVHDELDREMLPGVVELCKEFGSALAAYREALHDDVKRPSWFLIELLSIIVYVSILLIDVHSQPMQLSFCFVSVFSITIFTTVIADINQPYHGFFTIDMSPLMEVLDECKDILEEQVTDDEPGHALALKRVESNNVTLSGDVAAPERSGLSDTWFFAEEEKARQFSAARSLDSSIASSFSGVRPRAGTAPTGHPLVSRSLPTRLRTHVPGVGTTPFSGCVPDN